ncbi:MAG: ABC transporter ATP-binding protein [Gammaproteobacteria bacterium]|jgi:ABC-2 type transport system ATP-binding protein|nr:ABC transporter ATP-binding protein [Gammaproteobacteria bacterium]
MTLALSLRNLRKTYRNGFEALKGIDLDVAQGDFFALLGPNGAGKSTAIGIVSSLVNKTAGTVTVYGHDLDRDPEAVKACIGLVPQELNFNQFEPVAEIVVNQAGFYGVPRADAWRRAESMLRRLDLWDRRAAMARTLSGGMKRRLMIARALVHRPRLLILDEPTAGVDIEIRRSMWAFLRGINREGTTIILTTHYLEEAESLCRRIAIIDAGRIVEDAPLQDLLDSLHSEAFVLNLRDPVGAAPVVDGFVVACIDDHTLEVSVPRDRSLNALFGALASRGIEVSSLRNKENRLEQLFMDMVDRSRQGGAGP